MPVDKWLVCEYSLLVDKMNGPFERAPATGLDDLNKLPAGMKLRYILRVDIYVICRLREVAIASHDLVHSVREYNIVYQTEERLVDVLRTTKLGRRITLLQFNKVRIVAYLYPPVTPLREVQARQLARARQRFFQEADLHDAFCALSGRRDARLRPGQLRVLEQLQAGHESVVAVLPTAGGKSLLFQLPFSITKLGTTIVVVPYIALQQDLLARNRSLNLRTEVWDIDHPPSGDSIVLVTPEGTESHTFTTFINQLDKEHRLDRIVIDEFHLLIHENKSFRPAFSRLQSRFSNRGIPFANIAWSATQ
ncbi:hypothetical protein DTO039G3_432 [Penicillium roqueforti]|nr:hypothetical protein CBS147330_9 [Penicillium roqueforti]KAI3177073.1 hypothetical protein DTO039G3_432 [Penicillium roqueforti]